MKIKNRITSILEEEKLLTGDNSFDDILRRLKSSPAYIPSMRTVIKIAEGLNCSADFLLGLSDFREADDTKLDINFLAYNLKRLVKARPTKFFVLKKHGLLKEFPTFNSWLKGKRLPDTLSFSRLARKLDVSACELLKIERGV